jgi:hypothetical protein
MWHCRARFHWAPFWCSADAPADCRDLLARPVAALASEVLQTQNRASNHRFARAPSFPKFAKMVAAK